MLKYVFVVLAIVNFSDKYVRKVNDKKVNIPSFQVKRGDVISWTVKGEKTGLYENAVNNSKTISAPHWIELNKNTYVATMVSEPMGSDGELVIDTRQIVEFYSK